MVSGRFLLRLEPALHERLRQEAQRVGLSLNEYCARKLALPAGAGSEPAAAVLGHATRVMGGALIGLVAYGSFVRGEAMSGSDVDVLVVLERGTHVTRSLYRAWDAEPLTWNDRALDVHIVTLPAMDERVSGLWAEVAIDGIVLSDRDYRIGRYLVAVRRRIAAGEIARGVAHGQGYWREVG
jgi:predicted nucleotidyltransferase